MSTTFDFRGHELSGLSAGISPSGGVGTPQVLCTVPLATGAFALSSGRAVMVEAEFLGIDSNGHAIGGHYLFTVDSTMSASSYISTFVEGTKTGQSTSDGPTFYLNASKDLEVGWINGNSSGSGVTEDVAVRVSVRWIG